MDKNFGMKIICAAILFLCFVGTASATTWSVDDSGGANFTRIQDAINNAKDGDTIMVHSGVYSENVVVNKSVTLRGIGQPVVDAGRHGNAVTLTAEGITVEGFDVTNSGRLFDDAGIKVTTNNNIITGNNVSNNNDDGIDLSSSSNNNTITDNTVCNNNDGILLYSSSSNNTITGNTFVNDGLSIYGSYQNMVENNTVNGKPLVYLKDVSNYTVDDAGQVILVNCTNITVENLDLSNTSVGIDLWDTEDSTISNNEVCNNNCGVCLVSSSNNTISCNNASNNSGDGIYLSGSNNNTITGNHVSNNNDEGICLRSSSNNNTFTGNNVCNNTYADISFELSNNNTITGNNISSNYKSIDLYSSRNNKIYLNNFINNTDNIHYWSRTNIWNSTEKITYTYNGSTYTNYLGNYWSDYEDKYPDAEAIDTTGIWDMPYRIDESKDNYPLMERFENYSLIRPPLVYSPAAEPIIAPGDNFTEFYILGPNETASDYPTNLTVGEDGKVIIGIMNHEYTNVTYQLEVWLSGELIDGNTIELKHNETWENLFTFRATKAGRQKLEFLLFKDGLKEPYRDLHLWVDVK